MLTSNPLDEKESIDDLSYQQEHKSLEQTMLDIACRAPLSVQLATFCIAFVLCWMARDRIDLYILLLWLTLTMSASATRFWALRVWIPSLTHLSAERKLELTYYFLLPVAIMLGSSGLFYESYRTSEKAVQVFMLFGLVSLSLATLNGARRPFMAVSLPIVCGMSLGMFYDYFKNDHQTSVLMALLSWCFLFAYLRFAQLYHEFFFIEAYKRQTELSDVNSRLSKALEEVKAASESKNLFFASASHDLRQPIHTLSLLTAALSMRQMDDQAKNILGKVESAIQNLSIQMDSMLDIAKLDAGVLDTNIQRFNLSTLLSNLIAEHEQLAGQKKLALSGDIPDDIFISSDKILLNRLLMNLLSNAIKYTEQGRVSISAYRDDQSVNIDIVDTGIGVSDNDKRRIFDEFFQVANPERDRRKGLGLGLSIVRRLSSLLDIKLDFESTIGKGSCFSLTIPVNIDTSPDVDKQPEQDRQLMVPRDKTLLCVDDEKDVLSAMKLLFADHLGYELLTASTTKEAMRKAVNSKPDALLVDFRLSDGGDGLEVIRQIREIYPSLPALLISGDTSPQRLQQANDAGISLLSKPVGFEKLENALADLFDDE